MAVRADGPQRGANALKITGLNNVAAPADRCRRLYRADAENPGDARSEGVHFAPQTSGNREDAAAAVSRFRFAACRGGRPLRFV
jgi:hypothetical protein